MQKLSTIILFKFRKFSTSHILETAASENLRKLSFNIDMDAKVRELKVNRSAMRKN